MDFIGHRREKGFNLRLPCPVRFWREKLVESFPVGVFFQILAELYLFWKIYLTAEHILGYFYLV